MRNKIIYPGEDINNFPGDQYNKTKFSTQDGVNKVLEINKKDVTCEAKFLKLGMLFGNKVLDLIYLQYEDSQDEYQIAA